MPRGGDALARGFFLGGLTFGFVNMTTSSSIFLVSAQQARRPVEVDSPISAHDPDWERERPRRLWDPPRRLLRSLRRYQRWHLRAGPIARLISMIAVLEHRFWSVVTGADIPLNCRIGGGLLLLHTSGIVIHPNAIIGPNCLILQQVTLVEGVEIGGHVDIGAGAKIVRPVRIGNHAKIGANAVVLCDIPPGGTAVGIPAHVIQK
jgi:serine O-acetyltransferase